MNRYTNHININKLEDKQLNIYDPSSGWGGRILGAMSSLKTNTLYWYRPKHR